MTAKIKKNQDELKILNGYLADLNGIFLKKLGEFINNTTEYSENARMTEIKLIAMLQEITRIKKLTVL